MAKQRKLFEEVGADTPPQPAPAAGGIDRGRSGARGAIRVWLGMLFALVFVMIAVGGLTRLTDSGLSITEWAPISGALPPMTAEAWEAEFELYRAIPEYQLQNKGMTMAEFQVIYWWEWGHRQLGRVIGLVWALGFFGFLLAGKIPGGRQGLWLPSMGFLGFATIIGTYVTLETGHLAQLATRLGMESAALAPQIVSGAMIAMAVIALLGLWRVQMDWKARLLFLGFLGGLQGAIGWWMVASGLTGTMLDVASYRLATHLGLAFIILGLIAWYYLHLGRAERDLMQARRGAEAKTFSMTTGLMHLAFVQILIGALVAGIDAGRSYNDWPLMAGEVFPSNAFDLEPIWRNFFENPGLVQFIHRAVGYLLFVFGVVVWLRGRRSPNGKTRMAYNWVLVLMFGQVVLGIVTVLSMAPLEIAIAHQALAVILWVAIIRARFLARYPVAQSIRSGA